MFIERENNMRYNLRNWVAVAAWNRNGGTHQRSRNEARGGQRNEQRDYINEYKEELDIDFYDKDSINDCWD